MNIGKRTIWNLALLGVGACGIFSSAALAQSDKLPDGPGKATTEKVCGNCHGAEVVIGRQETRSTWAAIVDDMVQRGATGTDQELAQVVDYLATKFAKPTPPKGGSNQ
jgi:mono/diheme cytochrome c family protein